MNFLKSYRSYGIALLISFCCGCASQIDREIAELKQDVIVEQKELAQFARPYYANQREDYQIYVSKEPVFDTLNAFNATNRIIGVQSVGTGGWLAEYWTKCWPFDAKIGIYLKLAFPAALQAAFHVDPMTPSWTAGGGIDFPFNAVGVGGALLIGGAEFCVGSAGISPVPVLAGFVSLNNHGTVTLTPVPDQGIEYAVQLDHSPILLLGACAFGWCAGTPLPVNPQLSKGTIGNIVGKDGTVQITQTGAARNYSLNFNFDLAQYVDGGLTVAGPIAIKWTN
jgi:hypothetical protein